MKVALPQFAVFRTQKGFRFVLRSPFSADATDKALSHKRPLVAAWLNTDAAERNSRAAGLGLVSVMPVRKRPVGESARLSTVFATICSKKARYIGALTHLRNSLER